MSRDIVLSYYFNCYFTASTSSSPQKLTILDTSDTSTNLEFEEIPSREKQDILEIVQGIATRLNHGIQLSQRIVMTYRAAMYLDKDYIEVLKSKNANTLLKDASEDDCLNKLVVISDIMTSLQMTSNEIADFIGTEMVSSIIKSRFYLLQNSPNNAGCGGSTVHFGENNLWGYDLDKEFHLFLELCPKTTILGNYLLKFSEGLKTYRKEDINTSPSNSNLNRTLVKLKEIMENQVLSHKKQNTIVVELLIKAHDCFVHECSMEGIVYVLQKAKILNQILDKSKSWKLIVRLLVGIARYREMYYCFESLIENDQFESLLGQFDENHTNGLKTAIISYLHENCPENNEYYKLTALHFSMYKELAEMWENEAKTEIAKILSQSTVVIAVEEIPFIKFNEKILIVLTLIMEKYAHAAENWLLDNKLGLAQKSAFNAELIAMQIHLVKQSVTELHLAPCVLNIGSNEIFRHFVTKRLNVPQSLILERAYSYDVNWAESIFTQYIMGGNESYLKEFTNRIELTEEIVENVVKRFVLVHSALVI